MPGKTSRNGIGSKSRRTVLKTLGTLTGTSLVSASQVAAHQTRGPREFVGVSYDPVTQQIQGEASATLELIDGSLKGVLKVAGFTIPLGQQEALESVRQFNGLSKYVDIKRDSSFKKDDLYLKVDLDTDGDRVVGNLTRPSSKYGKISFSLGASDAGYSTEGARKAIESSASETAKSLQDEISVPATGVPVENSIRNVPNVGKTITRDSGGPEQPSTTDDEVTTSATDYKTGVLSEGHVDDSMSYEPPSTCVDTSTQSSSWQHNVATSARDADPNNGPAFYEILHGDYKFFWIKSHFEKVPDPLPADCESDAGVPYPDTVEFWARHDYGYGIGDFDLDDPRPDDKDESSNPDDGLIGTALDVVGALTTNVYAQAATVILDFALSTSNPESDVEVVYSQPTGNDGYSKEEYYWDLNLDGSEWPSSTDTAAGVQIQVTNSTTTGDSAQVDTRGRYSFRYLAYYDGKCPCDTAATYLAEKTTLTCFNIAEFDSV